MGWNKKGKRITFIKNTGKRTNISLICSITNKKILHYEIHNTSVNKNVFINYVKKINKKSNRKYILLDNARVHHSNDLKKYMINKSNKLLYNVPYNPETNPIEQMFNKVKQFVRKEDTSTYCKLIKAINKSIKIHCNNICVPHIYYNYHHDQHVDLFHYDKYSHNVPKILNNNYYNLLLKEMCF